MDYQAEWSDRSLNNFRSIITYLDERNPAAADRVREEIIDRIAFLQSFPHLGEVFQRLDAGEVRETQAGNYRIFYLPEQATQSIRVLAIQHVRRKVPDFSE